ncbi:MAG TPA: MoxR family ATPase [Bradyrhizobium sp.]|nr:MoxR family ATPase [Bradyrhizobium sp.]
MEFRDVSAITEEIRGEIRKAVVGQDEVIDLMLTSLLCGGHILLEGVPGTAKTLLAQCFAAGLSLKFGRVQFTPDMMPGDLLGTNLFNFQTSSFTLTQGPIFTDILLADEINRTPPKTQAALLQAMNERNVTVDGVTYALGDAFMVVATQNPIEQQGTYPLPEAQLDRFLFKIILGYPSKQEELDIVARHGGRTAMPKVADFGLSSVVSRDRLLAARELVSAIRLGDPLVAYIVDIVRSTRNHPSIETGASTRAANMLASASRAHAATQGRDFVIPDDIKFLAVPLLRHRIVLAPNAEIDGLASESVVIEILEQTAVPR